MAKKKVNKNIEPSQNMRQLPVEQMETTSGEVVIYNPDDTVRLGVRLENETVWLTHAQMGLLFGVDRTVIVRHVGNIYKTGELEKDSTCAKIAQVQWEGGRNVKRYQNYYNLDIAKHDAQYPPIPVKIFTNAHDRFLIIDDQVYHIGASLKDLGKKWFAFSLMESLTPADLISHIYCREST